jgi:hypothetical protein
LINSLACDSHRSVSMSGSDCPKVSINFFSAVKQTLVCDINKQSSASFTHGCIGR